jgi:hypothetical protein
MDYVPGVETWVGTGVGEQGFGQVWEHRMTGSGHSRFAWLGRVD